MQFRPLALAHSFVVRSLALAPSRSLAHARTHTHRVSIFLFVFRRDTRTFSSFSLSLILSLAPPLSRVVLYLSVCIRLVRCPNFLFYLFYSLPLSSLGVRFSFYSFILFDSLPIDRRYRVPILFNGTFILWDGGTCHIVVRKETVGIVRSRRRFRCLPPFR